MFPDTVVDGDDDTMIGTGDGSSSSAAKRHCRRPGVPLPQHTAEWLAADHVDRYGGSRCLSQLVWRSLPETPPSATDFLAALARIVGSMRGVEHRCVAETGDVLLYATENVLGDAGRRDRICRELSKLHAVSPVSSIVPHQVFRYFFCQPLYSFFFFSG